MNNTHVLPMESPKYPGRLVRALDGSAPKKLHCRGNLDLLLSKCIGFSGSRKASPKGLEVASTYAAQFAREGWTVTSGYANGVDVASHRAALAAGGSTILVLPYGLDDFWVRPDLRDVWNWSRTLVVSQFEPAARFQAYKAIQRNAVIAALSQGVLVFEAATTGGTLNTGLTTLRLKIELFAALYAGMPPEAVGNRLLVARGANPLRTDKDTLQQHMESMTCAMELRPNLNGCAIRPSHRRGTWAGSA